jgi:hypothetical protein
MKPKPETLQMERTSKPASDREIEIAADDILALLKQFDSPKDAGAAFTLAHYKMTIEAFPPAFRMEAVEAVKAHADMVQELLAEEWQ